MFRVPLENVVGQHALVDSTDYKLISKHTWRLHSAGYAMTKQGILMHRLLLNAKQGEYVDHRNRNKLDNRKTNIRIVTQSANMFNQKHRSNNKTGVRGVTWDKERQKWFACIRKNRKTIWTRRYTTIAEAEHAYKAKALEVYGEIPC